MTSSRPKSDYSTVSNSARQRENSIYIGFVKANNDAQAMGRLQVYIPEIGGDPTNPAAWITVGYASPFGGSSSPSGLQNNQTMAGSQTSYGWWGVPPDIDNQVLVGFVNGDLAKGYWWACIYQQNMNFMVPGIPAGPSTSASNGKPLPPTVEYNKLNVNSTSTPTRPTFTPLATGLTNQGLSGDFERGPASSGARREAPSKVFGYNTPDASQLYADDNPANQFIRFRTKSGVQVIIHETNGYVYINSKSGNSWVEISDLGVDIYSQNSVSIRGQQDVNIRADRNINMDAGGAINLRAGSDILMQAGGTIQLGAKSGMTLSVSSGSLILSSSGDYLVHSGGAFRTQSAGDTTMLAGGSMNRTAAQINDNGPAAPAVPATAAKAQPGVLTPNGGGGGNLNTTVSRMPAHEPWSGHPKSNVPPIVAKPHVNGDPSPSGGSMSTVPNTRQQQTGDGKMATITDADGNQCGTGVGTKKCSDSSYSAIQAASAQTGAPFGSMMAFADTESAFNPGAANSSGAQGLYQFMPKTWNGMIGQYGGQYNIPSGTSQSDPNANATMGGAYYQQNVQHLQNAGISDPSCGQVYMCHLLGPTGGTTFINAAMSNPDAPLGPPAIGAAALSQNAGLFTGCTTVGQAYNKLNGTMNAKAAAYDMQAGLPSPCSRAGATQTASTGTGTGTSGSTGASATGKPPPSSYNAGFNGPPPFDD
jgi:hypothetical protein